MTLAVILLNWRDLQKTLRGAARIQSWAGPRPELMVVDNESDETSRSALAEALGAANVIASGLNRGYGGGNNLGIAAALQRGAQHILLLNSDAEISEQSVAALLGQLDTHPDIAAIGPVIRETRGGKAECLIGGRDIASHVSTHERVAPEAVNGLTAGPLRDVAYVPGTVFLARRGIFEQIGNFDERFFFGGEAADFCRRARNAGLRVCVDLGVEARHDTSLTPDAMRRTLYRYYTLRNRFLYVRKHHPDEKMRYLTLWTKVGMAEIARAMRRGKLGEARAVALALADGWSGRYGNRNALFLEPRGGGKAGRQGKAARDASAIS